MSDATIPAYFYPAVICAVMAGNLLTLLLLAGWRGYLRGRKTPQGAPAWSYFAILFTGIFAGGGFVALLMSFAAPMQ